MIANMTIAALNLAASAGEKQGDGGRGADGTAVIIF